MIAGNAGFEGAVGVERIRGESDAMGFNAATGKWEDLRMVGIIDPAKHPVRPAECRVDRGPRADHRVPHRGEVRRQPRRGGVRTHGVGAEARRRIERGSGQPGPRPANRKSACRARGGGPPIVTARSIVSKACIRDRGGLGRTRKSRRSLVLNRDL